MTRAARIGIHDLAYATAHNVLDLRELAEHHRQDVDKFYVGIGQKRMSVPGDDEDIVTIGAEAARTVIERHGADGIRTLLFATESGIDQSKAAGIYAHRLLGLDGRCRIAELKQACYSGTAALQFALGVVARDPSQRVLVIASDTARYTMDSSGEATQGAAAVAFLVTAEPALLDVEPVTGLSTTDIHDFWRPNYRSEALVDGKSSIVAYLNSLRSAWTDYRERDGHDFAAIDRFCYHQPFSTMAVKAHARLVRLVGAELDAAEREAQYAASLVYNREVGNSYTASLYLGLLSLLDNDPADLDGARVGLFSYGSGSVSEFFTGVVRPGYRALLRRDENQARLAGRRVIGYERYAELHRRIDEVAGGDYTSQDSTPAPYRFLGVEGHIRRYEVR